MARATPRHASAHPPLARNRKHANGAGRLLTADDPAARWQVKTSHIHRLTREGALPTVRLGRYYRYRLEAVDQFERGGGLTA